MFQRDYDSEKCANCERRSGCTANCVDCGKIICTECAGCNLAGILTCNNCIESLLAPGEDDEYEEGEPDCTCEQVDVDRMDASGCELHARRLQ